MKRFFSILCITIVTTLWLFPQQKTLTILHTNDIHASFIPHEAFWIKGTPKPLIGGFNELSFKIDSLRKIKSTSILLDGGDVMTGNPITEYAYKGVEGGALFEMMNMVGYDAWTFGNHDFDISQKNLKQLTELATFPAVNANIVNSSGEFSLNNKPYIVIEKNEIRIGIIGIMTQGLYNLVNQNNLANLKVLSPVETTQKYIDELLPKTDIILALTHEGVEEDSVLAANVHGLNVIVGGHSHTRLKKPKKVNSVLIVQTGSNCENLGILDLTIENHSVIKSWETLLPLSYTSERPKTQLSHFIDSIQSKIDSDYKEVLGTLQSDWMRGDGEMGIGNFISDAQREEAHADIAFMNNHGIRKNVLAGPITKRDLFEVLPFRNILVTFPVTGEQIQTIVRHYILNHATIQTSGILCTWKKNDNNEIVFTSFTVNGKPLDLKKTYSAAASDYLVGEAKRYLGIEVTDASYSEQTVFNAVEKKIRKEKNIDSKIENRIHEIQ